MNRHGEHSPIGNAAGRRYLRIAQYVFLFLAALLLGRSALGYARLHFVQAYETWKFERGGKAAAGSVATVSARSSQGSPSFRAADGQLVGKLEIPRIGVSAMVLEGDGDDVLDDAAGHIPSTPLPGEGGNVAVAAHRDTLFRGLKNIRKDDTIVFATATGTYQYRVLSMEKVLPGDVQVLKASEAGPTLTLVTCYPFNYVGHAPMRFIVKAAQVDAPQSMGSVDLLAQSNFVEDDLQNSRAEPAAVAGLPSLRPGAEVPPMPQMTAALHNPIPAAVARHADDVPAPKSSQLQPKPFAKPLAPKKALSAEDDDRALVLNRPRTKHSWLRGLLGGIPRHFKRERVETSAMN